MKAYAVAFVLIASSLYAQTKSSPDEFPPKPQSAPESATGAAKSKVDPTKEADIRRFMELAGVATMAVQIMDGMEKSMKPLMVNAFPPGTYRDRLIDLFFAKFHEKAGPKQLLDLAVPVYDKYYTAEDIKGLVQFYESPLGKKLSLTQPKLAAELQEIGRQWGEGLGRDSMVEVLGEHPDLAEALKAAQKPLLPPE